MTFELTCPVCSKKKKVKNGQKFCSRSCFAKGKEKEKKVDTKTEKAKNKKEESSQKKEPKK